MMRDDAEPWETLEEPGEHHTCHGDATLERPAEHLPHLVFRRRLVQIIGAATWAERMHPDGDAVQLCCVLEDRPVVGMVERATVDAGQDLHPPRAERTDSAVHL